MISSMRAWHSGKNMSFSMTVSHRLRYLFCLFFSLHKSCSAESDYGATCAAKDHATTGFLSVVSFYCRHLFLLNMIKPLTQNSTCES